MHKTVVEGKVKVKIPSEAKVHKQMGVFYNPIMRFNRDVSIALLNSVPNKKMQMALPLAASGVRGIRFLKELKRGKIKSIAFNDHDENAVRLIKTNLGLNKLGSNKLNSKLNRKKKNKPEVIISKSEANVFLLKNKGFDYIDLDVFGSPVHFLDSAIQRLSRNGILAVTATDTGALCGTFLSAGRRKYWATGLRNELMHEIGLRILIRRVQLAGTTYNKALIPIFSCAKDHYLRIFFKCEKGKQKVDDILKQYRYFLYCNNCLHRQTSRSPTKTCCGNKMIVAGPIWTGRLCDPKLATKITSQYSTKMKSLSKGDSVNNNHRLSISYKQDIKFLKKIGSESKINSIGFFDLHKIAKRYKTDIPKTEILINKLKKNKIKHSLTHFSDYGIKTNMDIKGFVRLMKN